MPEWSNGPHSKCGVRATVPGVRIPLFPLNKAYKKLVINLVGFFYTQKDAPKMHRPHFYTPLRAFFKSHISHISYPISSFCQQAQNAWCNFSAIFVKKMHEKRNHFRSSLLKMSLHQHSPFLIPDSKIWSHCPKILVSSI